MPTLTVALTPAAAAPADVCVVVDQIRATSTIAQALASGYERVICVGEIEDALARRGAGVVLGGERHGVRIDGFDLGNSPAEYVEPRGHTLVLSTTNGTRALLQAAREAQTVLAGALSCLSAVAACAVAASGSVAIRCAGVRGAVALDDLYVAGRLVELLRAGRVETDEARVARAVVAAYATPLDALRASQSARDLDGTGLEADVERCAIVDALSVAPEVTAIDDGAVTLTRSSR